MTHSPRQIVGWSIGIFAVLFYALIPVAWITSLSLKTSDQLSDKKFFSGFSFDNYDVIFSDDTFIAALINSIGIASIATFISIVLAAMAAYATSRLDFPGKTVILSGALAVAMFPPISIVGSLFDMWRSVGLYDTWLGLIIPYMTFTLPLAIYTLSAFFREIPWELEQAAQVDGATPFMALLLLAGLALVPDELHEAAKVDGASTVQRFFRITLPLMRPAILVALLFRTLDAFRIFDNIYIIQPGGALGTESVSILGYNVLINRVNLGLGSAVSILIFICVILIAVLFVKGLGTSTAQQRGET